MGQLANLENVLSGRYGLKAEDCREGDWYRFKIKGLDFQGGQQTHQIVLSIGMDRIDLDRDINEIYAGIDRANREVGGWLKLDEVDNYFQIVFGEAEVPTNESEDELHSLIELMIETAQDKAVQDVVSKFGAGQ